MISKKEGLVLIMREPIEKKIIKEEVEDHDSFWDQFDYKPLREIVKEPPRYDQTMEELLKLLYDGTDMELPEYRRKFPTDKEYFWDMIIFRPCEEADLPGIMELDREAFPDPWNLDSWKRELNMKTPTAIWYVADVGGRIAAFAGVWVAAGEAQLMKIAVKKEVRHQGVGDCLLYYLTGASQGEDAEFMTLEVRESNVVAQKFYEHCGFVSQGIRPGYYSDTHEGAVIMRRDWPVEEMAELMRYKGCNKVIPVT